MEAETTPIRLHMPAIPHTLTTNAFSHCAFTGKVLRFAPMMRSRGFEVYHYGVETSEPDATEDINLFTLEEWEGFRIASYLHLHPEQSIEEATTHFANEKAFVGDLGNMGTPLYAEFNKRFHTELIKHYRSPATDIVCLPFGPAHEPAIKDLDVLAVESGIGYPNSYREFRIFESYAKLHLQLGKDQKSPPNYWFVVPNYYNVIEWPLSLTPEPRTVGFFGRICDIKGCLIVSNVAEHMPDVKFVLCGQGDPEPYLASPNIEYKPPLQGEERGAYLGSLTALLVPSLFAEPFCGVAVEAQLCGTPVITRNVGAQTETVKQGKTGMRCHTLADFCHAVRMACEGKFDREYISARAAKRYDMYNVAKQYETVFKNLTDLRNGNGGWYAEESNLES